MIFRFLLSLVLVGAWAGTANASDPCVVYASTVDFAINQTMHAPNDLEALGAGIREEFLRIPRHTIEEAEISCLAEGLARLVEIDGLTSGSEVLRSPVYLYFLLLRQRVSVPPESMRAIITTLLDSLESLTYSQWLAVRSLLSYQDQSLHVIVNSAFQKIKAPSSSMVTSLLDPHRGYVSESGVRLADELLMTMLREESDQRSPQALGILDSLERVPWRRTFVRSRVQELFAQSMIEGRIGHALNLAPRMARLAETGEEEERLTEYRDYLRQASPQDFMSYSEYLAESVPLGGIVSGTEAPPP